jgi:predicted Fe-Mo cluster-binding NifX family protein
MRIAVTANGVDLDAAISPVFGRCSTYILVDTETMQFEALQNPALNAAGGAGIQAAQFIIERGAQAVVTGNVGPNAFGVFGAADLPVYLARGGTVRDVVEAYQRGLLESAMGANVAAHSGTRGGGAGRGRGLGRRR